MFDNLPAAVYRTNVAGLIIVCALESAGDSRWSMRNHLTWAT